MDKWREKQVGCAQVFGEDAAEKEIARTAEDPQDDGRGSGAVIQTDAAEKGREKTGAEKNAEISAAARMSEEERRALYLLHSIRGMNGKRLLRMRAYAGSFADAYRCSAWELADAGVFRAGAEESACWKAYERRYEARSGLLRRYEALCEEGVRLVSYFDADYPMRLRAIEDAPVLLYVRGALPKDGQPSAAIIGARMCSDYGRSAAEVFARELAASGVQIVSGLAGGIDAAAGRGALLGGGKSFGVLGSGIRICYPKESYPLYRRMAEGAGGVCSETDPDAPPLGFQFVLRNRIIAGLCDVLLVMEAKEKSGTNITADYALQQGKEIFALPGRITDVLGRGCNRLLKDGAFVLTAPEDVLDFFGKAPAKTDRVPEKDLSALAFSEKTVYSCLDLTAKHVEEIAAKAGLSLAKTLTLLTHLELKGYAVSPQSAYYRKAYE